MAIKYICDVCKSEIENHTDLMSINWLSSVLTIDGKRNYTEVKNILCGDCKDGVKGYMEEVAKRTAKK